MTAIQAQPARDELSLIRRIQAGEKELFYSLIEPYQRVIFMTALGICNNEHDAEDIAQEAFLKALKNLDQFRAEAKFSTWLVQITINEARMRHRKERKALYDSIDAGTQDEEGDYIPKDFADWREIPSEALQRRELREALTSALTSLPEIYRQVFILRDVQHMSIADTAESLGINEALVKTRLLRARLKMRDALAPGFDGSWSTGQTSWKKVRPW